MSKTQCRGLSLMSLALIAACMGGACSFGIELDPFFNGNRPLVLENEASVAPVPDAAFASDAVTTQDGSGLIELDGGAIDRLDAAVSDLRCALPNMLTNGDLEVVDAGADAAAGAWEVGGGTAKVLPSAKRSGAFGLHVCGSGGTEDGGAPYSVARVIRPVLELGDYHGRVWIRASVSPGPLPGELSLRDKSALYTRKLVGEVAGAWKCVELRNIQSVSEFNVGLATRRPHAST